MPLAEGLLYSQFANPGDISEEGYREPKTVTDAMINSYLAQARSEYPDMGREVVPQRAWEIAKDVRHGPNPATRQPIRPDLRDAEHYLYAMGYNKNPIMGAALPVGYNTLKAANWREGATTPPSLDAVRYGMMGSAAGRKYESADPQRQGMYDKLMELISK